MLCPNCNNELMNVNGRYICVECGKEVDESLTSISNEQPIVPEPVSVDSVNNLTTSLEPETLPSEKTEEISSGIPPVVEAPSVDVALGEPGVKATLPTLESTEPLISPALDNIAAQEIANPLPEVALAPEASSFDYVTATINSELARPTVVEENQKVTPVEPNLDTIVSSSLSEENNQPAIESTVEPTEAPLAETVVDSAVQPEVSVENVEPVQAQNWSVEALTEETPVASEATAVQPETAPEVVQKLVDPFEVSDPIGIAQSTTDPGLLAEENAGPYYQNPGTQTNEPKYNENKKLYIMLGVGVFLALLLLGGGLFAYLALTKQAKVSESNVVVEDWKNYKATDYSLSFPLTPEKSTENINVNDSKIQLEKISTKKDGVTYAIASGYLPESLKPSAELSEFVSALAKSYDGKVDKTEVVDFEGEVANNYSISSSTSFLKGEVILKSNKIYILEYFSKGDISDNFSRFISGFKFMTNTVE